MKISFKKIWLLSLLLIFTLAGCTSDTTKEKTNIFDSSKYEDNIKETNSPTESTTQQNLVDVVRVVDGDTIVVDLNEKQEKVRFLLIDTPESVHRDASKNTEFGKIASDFTKNLLENQKVSLEFDVAERDRYGRLLAYVYLDDEMINETLLKEGMAKVTVFQPNVKYVDRFRELEKEARDNKIGIWKDGVSAFQDNKQSNNENKVNTGSYIANANTMKFHKSNCKHANSIADYNKVSLNNRDEAIEQGYEPCKVCNP